MKCKSIIEIEQELRKGKHEKKGTFCPGCQTRDKRAPLLSRTGVPGWETGTTGVSQPGQINVFVVVILETSYLLVNLFHFVKYCKIDGTITGNHHVFMYLQLFFGLRDKV